MVTLSFATTILAGKQEGIRWTSPRGAGPAKRSCNTHNIQLNAVAEARRFGLESEKRTDWK